jgi:peptide methionine sulfoxide reductase msrA/msrB
LELLFESCSVKDITVPPPTKQSTPIARNVGYTICMNPRIVRFASALFPAFVFALTAVLFFQFTTLPKKESTSKEVITTQPYFVGDVATLAGGCFWCTEAILQETEGVIDVVSGYAGGQEVNPTYKDVYSEKTGHRESVQLAYDAAKITYDHILDVYLQSIDPTDDGGQFVDRGFSYTPAIFYHTDNQKMIAETKLKELSKSGRFSKPIVVKVIPFTTFYLAEEYHQDFYKKSEKRYLQYKEGSGRKEFKDAIWKDIESGAK